MALFTHLTLGTDDLAASREFFDKILAPLGIKRLFDADDRSGYGVEMPELLIIKPINGEPASGGNGSTVGLPAPSRAAVDAFHSEALAGGATDEGAPGPRPALPNLYAAYVRTPEGHKIVALTFAY